MFMAANFVFCCGCAAMIGRTGKDLGEVESKEQMHAILGEPPVARGVAEDGPYEEFGTHRVIAEDWTRKGEGYAMMLGMTCGASELVAVPYQLFLQQCRFLDAFESSEQLAASPALIVFPLPGALIARVLEEPWLQSYPCEISKSKRPTPDMMLFEPQAAVLR